MHRVLMNHSTFIYTPAIGGRYFSRATRRGHFEWWLIKRKALGTLATGASAAKSGRCAAKKKRKRAESEIKEREQSNAFGGVEGANRVKTRNIRKSIDSGLGGGDGDNDSRRAWKWRYSDPYRAGALQRDLWRCRCERVNGGKIARRAPWILRPPSSLPRRRIDEYYWWRLTHRQRHIS